MRRRIATAVLSISLLAMACSDSPTPTVPLRPFEGVKSKALADYIQTAIDNFLPEGFEDAVDARWSTVRRKKDAGDVSGAVHEFNKLSSWIDRKTDDMIVPAGMTKAQAAALIVVNMGRWLYLGPDADPLDVPTGDVLIEVVPAGDPLAAAVPSEHASVSWDPGATEEERVIVVIEDPQEYPAQCQGPLPTNRCQYPLFYRVESFPHERLITPGRLAVCLVTTGDRRPIEYPADEPDEMGHHGPLGERLALAHERPADPANYTPGSRIDGDIEILPLSATQSNLTDCHSHSTLNMGPFEKALHVAMKFVGKAISPKNAYAYDQGPEHEFSFFSHFNAVDPESQPDLTVENVVAPTGFIGGTGSVSYAIANASRRANKDATASAVGVMTSAYLSNDQTLGPGDVLLGTANLGTIVPDGTPQPLSISGITLPAVPGTYYVIVNTSQTGGLSEIASANNSVVTALAVTDVVFATGFEPTDAEWSATAGSYWHVSPVNVTNTAHPSLVDLAPGDATGGALPGPYAGTRALWFGEESTGNYAGAILNGNGGGTSTGSHSGRVTSPIISVPATNNAIMLSFRTWFEAEGFDANRYDLMTTWVEDVATGTVYHVRTMNPFTDPNGAARSQPFTSGGFNLAPSWHEKTVDLSMFRGRQVRLSFLFETRDNQYNAFRGWIVDDLRIRVMRTPPAFLTTFKTSSIAPVPQRAWQP